jgi:hypothetical protein
MNRLMAAVVAGVLAGPAAQAVEPGVDGLAASPGVTPAPAATPVPALPTVPAPAAAARAPRQRDSWYIGFGLGSGAGQVRIGDETHGFDDLLGRSATPLSINFHVGATITPKLLVGLHGGALAARATNPDEAFQLNAYDVAVTYFPWERGAFARAAAGRSVLVVDTDGPVLFGTGSYGGWNALGGIGYAFWLGESFNLTLNLDYQAHFFSGAGAIDVARGGGWSAWIGFDWY